MSVLPWQSFSMSYGNDGKKCWLHVTVNTKLYSTVYCTVRKKQWLHHLYSKLSKPIKISATPSYNPPPHLIYLYSWVPGTYSLNPLVFLAQSPVTLCSVWVCGGAHWSIGGTRKWVLLVFTVAQLIQMILKSSFYTILHYYKTPHFW